jgi:hypothetical protein
MKNSWTSTFRRLAAGAIIIGSTTLSSAMCYAQQAFDSATDPVYDVGPNLWDEGDNGGFGFGPWSFDGTYTTADPGQQAKDDGLQTGTQPSSQHNNLGEAWTLFNPLGPTPGPEPNDGTDIARAGRSLGGNFLRVGQTLSITIDNPTQRNFFRGLTVRFVSGGANICYAGDNCSTPAYDPGSVADKLRVGLFEYFNYGVWYDGNGTSPLFDTDTNDGLTISLTRTGRQQGVVTMSSPGNPVHTESVNFTGFENANGPHGAIDWIMVEYFGTDSDTYPTLMTPRAETDFYISSMSLSAIPEPGTVSLLVLGAGTLLGVTRRRERKG